MKINKNMMWVVGILLIGIVVGVGLTTTKPVFDNELIEGINQNDSWSLDCDGKGISFIWNSYGEDYNFNDVELISSLACSNGTTTNIKINGNDLLINSVKDVGFDSTDLKEKECIKLGLVYDSETNECIEKTIGVTG